MSSDTPAIRARDLTKIYPIYERPQDRLKQIVVPRIRRMIGRPAHAYYREFHALQDVSFDVLRGETVAIIGRNGSGKSTLLQMICGTLMPTSGQIETHGRITALLELGAGFNPEFTGRENVWMNGALLGLSRAELTDRFDQIAAFADIGEFIDQPVKLYSSGMYVRLAFALNVMCDPEIMIVDEALAVGDMRFQARCVTALRRIQARGATVLFVSHDMGAVKSLCDRAIFLERGQKMAEGPAAEVAEKFVGLMRMEMSQDAGGEGVEAQKSLEPVEALSQPAAPQEGAEAPPATLPAAGEGASAVPSSNGAEASGRGDIMQGDLFRYGSGEARIDDVELLDADMLPLHHVEFDQEVWVRIDWTSHASHQVAVSYYVQDDRKIQLLGAGPGQIGEPLIEAMPGQRFRVMYRTRLPLHEGNYSLQVQLTEPIVRNESARFLDVIPDARVFSVMRRESGRLWAKMMVPNQMRVERLTEKG